ncbi:hypothetical protein [Chromobacterium amazonense]|uniref:hypothetical protein n=1 Tax=Chromobacterium amazonense TaxID=1382803 RepID=UPI003D0ACF7B
MPVHGECYHQPEDLLGRQFTPPYTGLAGYRQRMSDPLRVNLLRKCFEIRVFVSLANHGSRNKESTSFKVQQDLRQESKMPFTG